MNGVRVPRRPRKHVGTGSSINKIIGDRFQYIDQSLIGELSVIIGDSYYTKGECL